jgi:SagB-type dehydrogenase family enzyme
MADGENLRLRRDATLVRDGGRSLLRAGFVRMAVGEPGPGVEAALAVLRDGGATERELARAAIGAGGEQAALPFQQLLRRLRLGGWLERTLVVDGRPVATLRPLGHRARPPASRRDPARQLVLSRFALVRGEAGETLVETPRAAVQVVLHDPGAAAVVLGFARAQAPASAGVPAGLVELLADASVLVEPGEEDGRSLAPWTFHELLFHARSRFGRNVGGFGGTYRLEGVQEPWPSLRPAVGRTTALPVPDLDARRATDPPLVQAMEERRSLRAHDDDRPIDAAQLGELLYRCARVRRSFSDDHQELSSRPYPAGGSCYELEVYPLIRLCAGIEPGLYRYEAGTHALEHVAEPGAPTQTLLEFARIGSLMDAPPQVVLLLASRFGRVAWKYESMAYALTLKHVGALFQSLYLAATALGLAPCAQGGGDADAFAAAAGVDYDEESSVGEFVVGSRREDA